MLDKLVTLFVLNLFKSKDEKELHSLNIEDISNVLYILKFSVENIFFKSIQSSNILFKYFPFSTIKPVYQ